MRRRRLRPHNPSPSQLLGSVILLCLTYVVPDVLNFPNLAKDSVLVDCLCKHK